MSPARIVDIAAPRPPGRLFPAGRATRCLVTGSGDVNGLRIAIYTIAPGFLSDPFRLFERMTVFRASPSTWMPLLPDS